MKTFNLVILGIFGLFIVGGVIALATFSVTRNDDEVPARALVWGTLPQAQIVDVIDAFNQDNENVLEVTYEEIPADRFDTELAERLAAGTGPDAVIISQAQVLRHQDKLYPISIESYPERLFRDTFIQGGEIFTTPTGTLALPLVVDPLVMYWNRTLFTNARVANPPQHWDELLELGESLTKKDASFNITQSVAALGEYRNVVNAQAILATLVMQAGDPISTRDSGGRVGFVFGDRFGLPEAPAESALRFYTEFANPVKPAYSWNRALPSSSDMFARGDLALYAGFASELFEIQERNPNLNFDMTAIPQVRGSTLAATFGNIYAIGLIKQSQNVAGAYRVATILSGADVSGRLAQALSIAPARRDLLAAPGNDRYAGTIYREALIAQGFLDPDPAASGAVFQSLVEKIISGNPISRSVSEARAALGNLVR